MATTNFNLPIVGPDTKIAPIRDLFNAVSNATEAALTKAALDSGWYAVTPTSGVVAAAPVVRRIGSQIFPRGVFQFASSGTIGTSFITLGKLPAGFAPTSQWAVGFACSLPVVLQGMILPTGEVQVRTFETGGAAYTSSSSFSIVGPWLNN